MPQNEPEALMLLSMISGVGPVTIHKIVAKFGSALQFMALPEKERNPYFRKKPNWTALSVQLRKEVAFISKNKVALLFPSAENYPPLLRECNDHPHIVYAQGKFDWLSKKSIAFVGTRNPSRDGKRKVNLFIEQLAQYDPVIVSGLAMGIDTYAHEVALACGLSTVAVLGNSLHRIYPATNKKLAASIVDRGCLLTEFYSTAGVDKLNFVRRNRIIAGLCEATVIVESRERGGALITAEFASGYDREVFAVPGCVFNEKVAGCNTLIKKHGAAIATSASDIVEMLNWDTGPQQGHLQQTIDFGLTQEEQTVCSYLCDNGITHLDELKEQLSISSGDLPSVLLGLELNGKIKSLPGNRYSVQ